MGLLVWTRAAVLGCSTGEADRTYLMLRAALRSLKGTLRMGRSPRMMAGTSRRSGMCSTGGRPKAGICGLIAILSTNRTRRIPKKIAQVWRPRRKRCQRLPLGSWKTKERWVSGTGGWWVLYPIVESRGGGADENRTGGRASLAGGSGDPLQAWTPGPHCGIAAEGEKLNNSWTDPPSFFLWAKSLVPWFS